MSWPGRVLLVVLLALVAAIVLGRMAELPVVYESWSTGACVRVEDPGGRYSCESPPPGRYEHVWVE